MGVPWEARVDLGKLLHPDPGKRPTADKVRAMPLFSSAFFTKAFFCDTIQPARTTARRRARKMQPEDAQQLLDAVQSITQHHEFRAAYARSCPHCVAPAVEFEVGVAPTGKHRGLWPPIADRRRQHCHVCMCMLPHATMNTDGLVLLVADYALHCLGPCSCMYCEASPWSWPP